MRLCRIRTAAVSHDGEQRIRGTAEVPFAMAQRVELPLR
jgi:hypothetical protein